jgi:radical SAM superfamily enzyme YgiQ (UPF0313 family)
MKAILINPKLLINKKDKLTTGIIYMPISLAYINSYLKKNNVQTKVIDLFSEQPKKYLIKNNYIEVGEDLEKFENDINEKCVYFIFANQVINHEVIIKHVRFLKETFPHNKVVIIENTQAVTAYSLRKVKDDFFREKVDILICGDPEKTTYNVFKTLNNNGCIKNISNTITKDFDNSNKDNFENLDDIPFPDWETFNVENYWDIRHSHGPLSALKYLPILTSRGCPYPCKFCIIPETTSRVWRGRSASNIVDEIQMNINKYKVFEYHLEDLNPTVNEKRIISLCNELINRQININWKIVSGTKIESIKNLDTLNIMAKAGCKYISISPESGSAKVMRLINKPFNLEHAEKLITRMNKLNIKSQACFVLGFPGENDEDIKLTKEMIIRLTKRGLDEIAIFIITPIPGSEIFEKYQGYNSYSQLNFSPTWRHDYKKLNKIRIKFYLIFLTIKSIYFPLKILKQIINFINRRFETKMEMIPYKFFTYTFFNKKKFYNEKN